MRWTRERAGRAALFRLRQSCDGPVPGSSHGFGERRSRTAKSCGPGAPRLALRLPGSMSSTTDGDNKVWSPGRARISRKTIRAGKAGMHRPNLWFLPRAFFPHGGHGCWPSTRSSLRPLISRGDAGCKTRVPSAARMRRRGPAVAINHSRGGWKIAVIAQTPHFPRECARCRPAVVQQSYRGDQHRRTDLEGDVSRPDCVRHPDVTRFC